MPYEHKPGSGSALVNQKRPGMQDPDFSGDLRLPDGWKERGPKYRVRVWLNKTKDGRDRLGFSLSPIAETHEDKVAGLGLSEGMQRAYEKKYDPHGIDDKTDPDEVDSLIDEIPF